jgi:hypothetical protein
MSNATQKKKRQRGEARRAAGRLIHGVVSCAHCTHSRYGKYSRQPFCEIDKGVIIMPVVSAHDCDHYQIW